jgi:hypothetical protein
MALRSAPKVLRDRLTRWPSSISQLTCVERGRQLDRAELVAKARLDESGVGSRQRVLGGQVLMDPISGFALPQEER